MTTKSYNAIISGHKAYILLILSGIFIHIFQAVFFYFIKCPVPVIYNVLSTFFYLLMLYLCMHHKYKICVTAIHLEIMVFASLMTIYCGWTIATPLYLIAASALVYFCPFENKNIPYIFSVMEAAIFLLLCIYFFNNLPIYTHIPQSAINALQILNTIYSFFMLIFASYLTNITASVTNQRLLAENKTLSVMANYDFLTGLLSRRAFFDRINTIPPQTNLVIAMGDLDDFKSINDTYGHSTGDYVLRTISQLISKYCNNKTVVCRWGGEEFIFYFQNETIKEAQKELQHLSNKIATYPFAFDGKSFNITVTFGLAEGKDDIDKIISIADDLLYEGKRHGKNQVYIENHIN